MILLFEGYNYPTSLIDPYLKGLCLEGIHHRKNGFTSLSYVGYFYNQEMSQPDMVCILPKVFVYNSDKQSLSDDEINEDAGGYLAFGQYKPEDILDLKQLKEDGSNKHFDFVKSLSIWIYQTLHRYRERNPLNNACITTLGRLVPTQSASLQDATLMDHILALRQFSLDNKSLFIFTLRNAHTGQHQVNWKKTITSSQPILCGNAPIYMDLITRKRRIDYDEELLVIFFSTLADIERKYGVRSFINEEFHLMSRKEFANFSRHACKRLRDLKYRYFSDKTIELWKLLYAYFKKQETLHSNRTVNDLLLVNNFHVVFEDMIDYLISDDNYPKELKEQYDGKEIDHIYRQSSLIYNDESIYYVGDSKYYSDGHELERKSIAKQYTYAKNIIQRNIDVFYGFDEVREEQKEFYLRYRDPRTEGYNVTPNFFISGIVNRDADKQFDFTHDDLKIQSIDQNKSRSQHFANRLFDRDTLLVQRYNINFLYVLSVYARKSNSARLLFRELAKKEFKRGLVERLSQEYNFYCVDLDGQTIEEFMEQNFRWVVGKVISFENDEHLFLAVEKTVAIQNLSTYDHLQIIDKTLIIQNRKYKLIPCELGVNGLELKKEEIIVPWKIEGTINENLKFVTHLPVYSIKAACGYFDDNVMVPDNAVEEWIDVSNMLQNINRSMFIVRAKGDSMSPKIKDGDLCVFEKYYSGSRNGEIVLTQCVSEDSDYECSYTIKKYYSEIAFSEDGSWHHTKIELHPINTSSYSVIEIDPESASSLKTIGIFKTVIKEE